MRASTTLWWLGYPVSDVIIGKVKAIFTSDCSPTDSPKRAKTCTDKETWKKKPTVLLVSVFQKWLGEIEGKQGGSKN